MDHSVKLAKSILEVEQARLKFLADNGIEDGTPQAEEVNVIFQDQRKAGRLDLEAVETAIRSAMHQAGASALTQLLQYDPPDEDQ